MILGRRAMIAGGIIASVGSRAALASRASFDAQDFGASSGPGIDNHGALQGLFDEVSRRGGGEVVIPRGRYLVSRPLTLSSSALGSVRLIGDGAELIFTTSAPQQNIALLTVAGAMRPGARLYVAGLSLRLARPAVRTAGGDMIRLRGFDDYQVEGVTIGSADNMGLTIGRGDVSNFAPQRIVVRDCRIGGRRERSPHSHASIGDTGIWIVTPAVETEVSDCVIRETGDDGIYIGHSASPAIRRTVIRGNSVAMAGGRGITVAVPGVEITGNRIDTTNICGIACERADGGEASRASISRNVILRAGQLEAGTNGTKLMPKVNPHAIFIYQSGGGIRLEGNSIEAPRGAGVCLYAHKAGDFAGLHISGGSFTKVGVDALGMPRASTPGVFLRGGAADSTCSDFRVSGVTVSDTQASLLNWQATSARDDRNVQIREVRLLRCRLSLDEALVRIGSRRRGTVHNVTVEARLSESQISWKLSPPDAKATVHLTP